MQNSNTNNIMSNDQLLCERVTSILREHSSGSDKGDSRETRRFENAILQGIVANLSIDEIAQMCCYSVSTFKRRFGERYQMPPHRWMLLCRMSLACEMLCSTRAATSDIATRCGFVNVSHFIATFRRHYGMTPTQYRRKQLISTEQLNVNDE